MPAFADPTLLRRIELFRELTLEQLTRVNDLLHRRTCGQGSPLIAAEHPGEVVYIIYSGTVKIYTDGEDEADVILAILGAGEVVGEMSLIDHMGRSANVVALEPTVLFWMGRAEFWECLHSFPALTVALAGVLSRRVRLANAQIQAMATLDVSGRVARQILAFAQEYGRPSPAGTLIPIRLTQTDLAGLVGASRVRVNQALSVWKQNKCLSVDRSHRITLRDSEPLLRCCR